MNQDDFKVEAYGVVTPPPDDVLPEPDDEPTTGAPDDAEGEEE